MYSDGLMRNCIQRKCLAIGIILLFVVIACSPVIYAQDDTIISKTFSIPKKEDTVLITVLEYKGDGTIGKSVVKMTQEESDKFHEELDGVQDLETRLSIYKKYNLISKDMTAERLRVGMEEKAQKMGITQNKLESMVKNKMKNNIILPNKSTYIDFFCRVEGHAWQYEQGIYLLIPFGTSLFTWLINNYASRKFISFDILDFLIGHLDFYSWGILGHKHGTLFHGRITMVGFTGIMWHDRSYLGGFIEGFDGFATYVKAVDT